MDQRLTAPNVLTAARVAMAAAAAGIAASASADVAAVAILIAAALLDVFDGWLARRQRRCSSLGKHLDPLADKLLMAVVYGWIGFDTGRASVWVMIALVGVREVAMTLFRSYSLRRHRRFIPANRLGRAKMFVQSVAGLTILSVVHFLGRDVPPVVVVVAMVATLIVSYVSGVVYVVEWRRGSTAGPLQSKGACRRPEADPLCATHDHG